MAKESEVTKVNPNSQHLTNQAVSLSPGQVLKSQLLVSFKEYGKLTPYEEIGIRVDYR